MDNLGNTITELMKTAKPLSDLSSQNEVDNVFKLGLLFALRDIYYEINTIRYKLENMDH